MAMNADVADATTATLMFLKPLELYQTQKPYSIKVPAEAVPDGQWSNEEALGVDVAISNMRRELDSFSLDKNGFEVVHHPLHLKYEDFNDKSVIEDIYVPRVEAMLKEKLRASNIHRFDCKIRRRSLQFPAHTRGGDAVHLQPLQGVHVDFTTNMVLRLAKKYLGPQAPTLLRKRCQIVNVWQPLFGPLQDWPLAVCDYNSIDVVKDLVPTDHVFPDRVEENYNLFPNPSQRWYYLKNQYPEEALLFKIYDSNTAVSRCVPHASFEHPDTPASARPRESIETRFFVFYDT